MSEPPEPPFRREPGDSLPPRNRRDVAATQAAEAVSGLRPPRKGMIVRTILTHYLSSLHDDNLTTIREAIAFQQINRNEHAVTVPNEEEAPGASIDDVNAITEVRKIFDSPIFRDTVDEVSRALTIFVTGQVADVPDAILEEIQERITTEQNNRQTPLT